MTRPASILFAVLSVALGRDRGELAGLVQDSSGGALVEAGVTVVNEDSGIRRTARTDGEGAYDIPGLPPGTFKVTVRKAGFQTVIRWNVQIGANQNARLDFVMPLGSVQQTVTIEGGASPMNANDASVGTFVGREAIESLPLNGRGVMSLVELAPGVVATPAANGEAGQFSASGQRANTNYFTVDGVSANTSITGAGLPAQFAGNALPAMTAFGSTGNIASMDALQEAHVLTSSFAPQYGRLPGAQVALTTRSGSNEFHGSASYELRNEALDANDALANANGLSRAPLRLNQWNATLGGPLYANRTFFFGSYEGVRLLDAYTFPVIVPSLAARAEAPAQVQPLVDAFPTPSFALANGLLAETIAHFSRPSRLHAASLRVDHALTTRIAIFGRFNWAPSRTQSGFSEIEDFRLHSNTFTLGIAAMPTPTATNDFRINFWNTTAASSWTQNPSAGGAPLDFSPLLPSAAASGAAFYGLAIGGVGDLYAGTRGESRQGQFNLVDTYSFTRGPHAFRLGLDYQRLTPARLTPGVSVTNWWPDLSAVLANAPPTTATTSADEASALVETLSVFAQDTWTVSSRLTFTYGLRWEITPAPAVREPAAATGLVDAAPVAPLLPVVPLTQPLWQTSYGQLAPRAGAAYRLSDRSVLRAGWGIFYDTGFGTALDPINAFPFNRWQFGVGASAPAAGQYGLRYAPDLKLPYVAEWNISLEHMFGLRNVVSASYVGSAGRRLLRYEGVLQPAADAAQMASATNDGRSSYNALQLQFRRRLASSLQGIASYAWSHAIDNGSYDSGIYLAAQELPAAADRGSASFDARHDFTAGFTYAPLRNWEFCAMLRARTGFPIDVLTTENLLGLAFDDVARPNLNPGVPIWLPSSTLGGRRLNPAAFSIPTGVEGNLGRNAITGFGMSQIDLSAERRFRLFEHGELSLRVDAYNALNHDNPADPIRFLDSPLFGTSASMLNLMLGAGTSRSGLAPAFQIGGPRALQISVRLRF